MSKFKVGDTVWTKPTEEIKATVGTYIPPVIAYSCNYQYIVNSIDKCGRYILKEDERIVCFEFAEEWLESEEEHQMRVENERKEKKKEGTKMVKLKDLRPGTIFRCNCYKDRLVKVSMQIGNFILCIKMNDGSPAVLDENVYVEHDIPVPLEPVEKLDVLATKALEHFGNKPQIRQTMEECAELIVALNKAMRYPEEMGWNVLEELADVTIMIEQMKQLYDVDLEFDDILKRKMNKLRNYLSEQEADE